MTATLTRASSGVIAAAAAFCGFLGCRLVQHRVGREPGDREIDDLGLKRQQEIPVGQFVEERREIPAVLDREGAGRFDLRRPDAKRLSRPGIVLPLVGLKQNERQVLSVDRDAIIADGGDVALDAGRVTLPVGPLGVGCQRADAAVVENPLYVDGQFLTPVVGHVGKGIELLFQLAEEVFLYRVVDQRLAIAGGKLEVGPLVLIDVLELNAGDDVVRDPLPRPVGNDLLPPHEDGGRADEEGRGNPERAQDAAFLLPFFPVEQRRFGPILANLSPPGPTLED